jgi:hypothetical protein
MSFRSVLHDYFNITDDLIMDRSTHAGALPHQTTQRAPLTVPPCPAPGGAVFKVFIRNGEASLCAADFVRSMSVFLRGTIEELVECRCTRARPLPSPGLPALTGPPGWPVAFAVYSLHGEEEITREEMFFLLKNCIVKVRLARLACFFPAVPTVCMWIGIAAHGRRSR